MPPTTLHTIGILGVRDFQGNVYNNYEHISSILSDYIRKEGRSRDNVQFRTGGGRGVESLVVRYAKENGIPCKTIPPNIQELGASEAFKARNNNVVAGSKELLVFWDGCIEITVQAIMTSMHLTKKVTVFPLV